MTHPTSLRSLLRQDEALRLKAYRDSRGILTIGWGRSLETKGISAEEAEYLFNNDIKDVEAQLKGALPWTQGLDEVRYAVIANMAYNLGIGGLLTFQKFLAAAEAGRWDEAAAEMLDSEWRAQVKGRAVRLAKMMREGTWEP